MYKIYKKKKKEKILRTKEKIVSFLEKGAWKEMIRTTAHTKKQHKY